MSALDLAPVSADVWKFEGVKPERLLRLNQSPGALLLQEQIKDAAARAAQQSLLDLYWERHGSQRAHRVSAKIALSETLFDWFFNGRCGYRAQHFKSEATGIAYNKSVVDSIRPILVQAAASADYHLFEIDEEGKSSLKPSLADPSAVHKSMMGSETKVWVPFGSFETESEGYLDLREWRRGGSLKGVRIPLPIAPYLDFKGTFIDDQTSEEIANKPILERAREITRQGYT